MTTRKKPQALRANAGELKTVPDISDTHTRSHTHAEHALVCVRNHARQMELTMENIGNMHGVASHSQAGDLMNSAHGRPSSASHRNLVSHGRSAMVSSMASILEGAGEYRSDPALSGHLHPAMTMCESGMSLSNTYTTLTPLQHLPPISTVSEKFHHAHPHTHPHHHAAHQRLATGNVSGSFTLMRDDRGLASMGNLYGHYPKDMSGMGQPLSPLSNGLGSLHNSQQALSAYGPGAHLPNDKMLSPGGFETHAAMLSRSEEHLRSLGGHGHGMISNLNGMHPHSHMHSQGNGSMLSDRERHGGGGAQSAGAGQVEEINTKEVAQRITAELKRYSIPQAIFAQRILCRSQGTLSDLLRNPKPWSKLKSGRETFRRMWKWLQEPEFQRMSALRLAGILLSGFGGCVCVCVCVCVRAHETRVVREASISDLSRDTCPICVRFNV
ncbi:unnamed protein product [Leuciscus chuanchicus]